MWPGSWRCGPQRPRPKHRDGEYQRGRYGSEIRGVEDEPNALPHVTAKGTQPAEQAQAERDGLNRYRGLHHLTSTVRQAARERYQDHRQYRQHEDATSDKLRRHNRCPQPEGRHRDQTRSVGNRGTDRHRDRMRGAGTGAPGRPNSCQALTSTQMAVTARRIQATGSRTRCTLSHARAVSDGTSSPS